jgi:molecular chaperone GrpE
MTDKKHPQAEPEDITPSDALAPPGDAPPAAPQVEPVEAAFAQLRDELDAVKDRYLRLAAEYDNFRKRTAKERADAWVRAQAELIQGLADALDDLSRFAHVDPAEADAKTLHEGVELVERKLWKQLELAGVTRIDQTGVPFDPNVHEAVTTRAAAAPEQDHTIGQVLQAGYKLRDQLLRPARVVVLTWQGEAE